MSLFTLRAKTHLPHPPSSRIIPFSRSTRCSPFFITANKKISMRFPINRCQKFDDAETEPLNSDCQINRYKPSHNFWYVLRLYTFIHWRPSSFSASTRLFLSLAKAIFVSSSFLYTADNAVDSIDIVSLNSVLDSILSVLDPRFFRAFKGTKCVLRPESNNYVQRHRFFFQESSGQSRFARYSLFLSRLLQIVTTAM